MRTDHLTVLAVLVSVVNAHWVAAADTGTFPSSASEDRKPCGTDRRRAAVPPPPPPLPPSSGSQLQSLLISFLPALTENNGRSKHVVGAFQCAVEVSD